MPDLDMLKRDKALIDGDMSQQIGQEETHFKLVFIQRWLSQLEFTKKSVRFELCAQKSSRYLYRYSFFFWPSRFSLTFKIILHSC